MAKFEISRIILITKCHLISLNLSIIRAIRITETTSMNLIHRDIRSMKIIKSNESTVEIIAFLQMSIPLFQL